MAVVPVVVLAAVAAVTSAGELGEEEGLLDQRQRGEADDSRGRTGVQFNRHFEIRVNGQVLGQLQGQL